MTGEAPAARVGAPRSRPPRKRFTSRVYAPPDMQLEGNMLQNSFSVQALLVCAALAGRGTGDQMTIPDHVSANGGRPVTLPLMRDIQPLAISTLSRADLIVYGRLVRLESYMNDAKTHVYTDYRIVPDRLIVDRSGSMGKVKRSGDAPSLIVVMNGGEIIVDGTSVKVDDLSQPERHTPARAYC